MQDLAASNPQELRAAIEGMSPAELERVLHDWTLWARPDQIPPPGDWIVWLLRGGRGSGKTRAGAEFVIDRAKHFSRIALVGQTKGDVRDTMIELGDSSILGCSPPWFKPQYEPSKRRLTWPNGCVATAYSGDEPDQLRGPQHDTAWVDELAKFRFPQETWDNLEFGLRLGRDPKIVVTTTPRAIPIIKRLIADKKTKETRCSTYDNIYLAESFMERIRAKYDGTRLGKQELYGEILDDNPNALWKRDAIEAARVSAVPDLVRVVVGVDPEAESGTDSAETGIITGGVAYINGVAHGYILDDSSIRAAPDGWAKAAVSAYHKNKADVIVGEVNNGGEMVGFTVKTVAPDARFKAVRASRGKFTRAEPVSALYEQGRIHHVGFFTDLEDQMCEWVPGDKSPDRLDALVWAITELILDVEPREKRVVYNAMQLVGNIDLR